YPYFLESFFVMSACLFLKYRLECPCKASLDGRKKIKNILLMEHIQIVGLMTILIQLNNRCPAPQPGKIEHQMTTIPYIPDRLPARDVVIFMGLCIMKSNNASRRHQTLIIMKILQAALMRMITVDMQVIYFPFFC